MWQVQCGMSCGSGECRRDETAPLHDAATTLVRPCHLVTTQHTDRWPCLVTGTALGGGAMPGERPL